MALTAMGKISLPDFFRYYQHGNVNQMEAIALLESAMPQSLLTDEADWVEKYREPQPKPDVSNPLPVKYFWQQDNGADGWRQCQTSSIAMCLNYLGVPGINDDVDYLKIVQKYGDTTLQSSHQQALKSLGVPARFKTDGSKQDLINRIDAGFPCPIGILHHGALPVPGPSGGGHYICLIGYTDDGKYAICHDPFGELSLVGGSWAATGQQDGKSVKYSWKNLLPRWDLNNGVKDGWWWEIGESSKK